MRPKTAKQKSKTKEKKNVSFSNDEASDDETAFQTPDRDNATDYGLEFTTSRLAELNTSPRRCSTLRKSRPQLSSQNRTDSEDSDTENQPPIRTPARRSPRKAPQPPPSTHNKQPNRTTQSKRKNKNPEHRLKKLNREILRLQSETGFLIPRLPFSRLVREIMMKYTNAPFMITTGALEALQHSSEVYLTQRFEDAYLLTQYRNRVTLTVGDMAMVAYFCRNNAII